jgi:hypothetical protein
MTYKSMNTILEWDHLSMFWTKYGFILFRDSRTISRISNFPQSEAKEEVLTLVHRVLELSFVDCFYVSFRSFEILFLGSKVLGINL